MTPLDSKAQAAVEAAIFAHRKIEAIKLYREAVPQTGLAEAKQAVEALEAQLRAQRPGSFGPEPAKTGCLGLVLLALSLAGGWLAVVCLVGMGK